MKSTHPAFCRIPSSTGICFIIWGSERFHLNNQLFPCNITERHDHAVSRFWVRRKEPRGESPPSAARRAQSQTSFTAQLAALRPSVFCFVLATPHFNPNFYLDTS